MSSDTAKVVFTSVQIILLSTLSIRWKMTGANSLCC